MIPTTQHSIDIPALRALEIGDEIDIVSKNSARGTIKRKDRYSYVMRAEHVLERTRWGTAAEIYEDYKYFVETSALPQPKSYGF